jgi:hypothetical protein
MGKHGAETGPSVSKFICIREKLKRLTGIVGA